MTAVPPSQVQKASHPLFKYCVGPAGFSRVALSTCPSFWSGQLRLFWPARTPWLWLEQKAPLHPSFLNGVLQRRVAFLKFAHVVAVRVWLLPGLRPELLEPRWGFNSCRSALIAAYCVIMVTTSYSRTALLLFAKEAMLSMSPLKDSMKSSKGIAPGGGTWTRPLFVAGRMASPFCAITWMCASAFAEPKESAEGLE